MPETRAGRLTRRRARRLAPMLAAFGASLLLLGGLLMVDPAALGSLSWTGLAQRGDSGADMLEDPNAGLDDGLAGADGAEFAKPTSSLSQSPLPPSSPAPAPVTLAGAFPPSGPGTFAFASSRGPMLGTGGTLRRFRVGVEDGAGEDLAEFAAKVDASLGDPRGWTASGALRLQRVPATEHYDFTIYLATPKTADKMCEQGGVNITVGGEPYTSCRVFAKVVINLARWRLSVPPYVSANVPLDAYRTYVINHEVGHQLGHRHEACPGKGRVAPVMQQQTLGLGGCTANPWPYLNGKRYAGPSV